MQSRGGLVTGTNVTVDDATKGTFTIAWPDALCNQSFYSSEAVFLIKKAGDVIDTTSRFIIEVKPTPGVLEIAAGALDGARESLDLLASYVQAGQNLDTDAKANVTAEANKQIAEIDGIAAGVQASAKSVADDATASKAANAKTVAAAASAINADRDKQLAAQAASAKSVADDAAAKKAAQAQSLTSVQADATKQKAAQAASAKAVADEAAKAKTAMDDAVTGATDKSIATITDADLLAWVTQEAGE